MNISLSQVVSVALVLAVVYYIMSMLISGFTKWVLDVLETRGKVLEDFLKNTIEDTLTEGKKFTIKELKKTPQINALRPVRYAAKGLGRLIGKTQVSDYVERIQPKVLVDALFDLEGTAADWKDKVKNVITLLPKSIPNLSGDPTPFDTKDKLIALVDKSYYSFDQWREKLETYFGSVMDQAAQKFGALAKTYVLWISLLLAFALGVDTIQIAGQAWFDPQLTQKANAYAETILQSENSEEEQQADLEALYASLDDMAVINLPWYTRDESGTVIGYPWYIRPPLEKENDTGYQDLVSPYTKWSNSLSDGMWLLLRILGIVITGIAVSQGSSFWYDIIRQLKGEQKKTDTVSTESTTPPVGGGIAPLTEAYAEPPTPPDEESPKQ